METGRCRIRQGQGRGVVALVMSERGSGLVNRRERGNPDKRCVGGLLDLDLSDTILTLRAARYHQEAARWTRLKRFRSRVVACVWWFGSLVVTSVWGMLLRGWAPRDLGREKFGGLGDAGCGEQEKKGRGECAADPNGENLFGAGHVIRFFFVAITGLIVSKAFEHDT